MVDCHPFGIPNTAFAPIKVTLPEVAVEADQVMEDVLMTRKPSYKELEKRVCELETVVAEHNHVKAELYTLNREREHMNQQLEQVLEKSNKMAFEAEIARIELNQILNTSANGLWVVGNDFSVLRINKALKALIGNSKDGNKCFDLFLNSLCHSQKCPLIRIQNGENRIKCEIERECKDGMMIPFILTATPFYGLDRELIGIVIDFTDISGLKQTEIALQEAYQELERLATVDSLTQVANRRRFDEHLIQEWNRLRRDQNPLSLILCDIDWFKLYNDTYGHQLGDNCLRAVSGAIRRNVRRPADLVARYGGEEFGIILPDTKAEDAVHVANMIREEVQQLKINHDTSPVSQYVTLSLGVACVVPCQESSPEALIEAADKALYEAKDKGRNTVINKTFQ